MNQALLSSKASDWRTPDNVLDLVRHVGHIVLDPATDEDNPVGATHHLWSGGLEFPWGTYRGLVYCNPPYGRALPAWAQKIASEGSLGTEVVALLPARTDTRWWQDHVVTAHALCFWRGRLRFVGAPASAPFPSAVAYWGHRRGRFCGVFSPHGWVTSAAYQGRLPQRGSASRPPLCPVFVPEKRGSTRDR